jgi:hypothetical protein
MNRTVAQKAIETLTRQGGIAKYDSGEHGVRLNDDKDWPCLSNMIYAIHAELRIPTPESLSAVTADLVPVIRDLFPGRELAGFGSGDRDDNAYRQVIWFNDHADTTLDDELLVLRTWLERNPEDAA